MVPARALWTFLRVGPALSPDFAGVGAPGRGPQSLRGHGFVLRSSPRPAAPGGRSRPPQAMSPKTRTSTLDPAGRWGNVVLHLAGHRAGMAADARALVDDEAVVCHASPSGRPDGTFLDAAGCIHHNIRIYESSGRPLVRDVRMRSRNTSIHSDVW